MIIPQEFVHLFTYPVTFVSVLANLTLIFIIVTTHNQHIGSYRFLLLAFAVVDIFISIVHFMVVPAIHMTDIGFIFYGLRLIRERTIIGTATDFLFVALFYQTFVLLAFHYVYRYVLICNPPWLRWIGSVNPMRNWITIAVVVDILYIGGYMMALYLGWVPNDYTRHEYAPMLKDAYNIDLWAPNRAGYLGISYRASFNEDIRQPDGSFVWSPPALMAIGIVLCLFGGTAVTIVFCIWQVRRAMATFVTMAARTRQMQNQLFRTLLIQTIVPTVTSYIPMGTLFLFPLTGIPLGGMGTVIMMSTALFPLIDPFLVIFLVSGYRTRLPSFLWTLVSSSTTHHTPSATATPNNRTTRATTAPSAAS